MPKHDQVRAELTIDTVDALTTLHSHASDTISALWIAMDHPEDRLPKSTVRGVLDAIQSFIDEAQKEVLVLAGRNT